MATILSEKKVGLSTSSLNENAVNKALANFNSVSFPTRKTEDWRYVKLGKLIKKSFNEPVKTAQLIDLSPFNIPNLACSTLVFVNGLYHQNLSCILPESGVTILSINEAKELPEFKTHFDTLANKSTDVFSSMNTAFTTGGAFISISKNIEAKTAIYILNISSEGETNYHIRNLIVVNESAQSEIIQGYFTIGNNENLNNSVTEIFVKKNAHVNLTKIQNDANTSHHICFEHVHQENDSTFKIHTIIKNGNLVRNGLNIAVDGTNCYSEMNGLILSKGTQFVDNHTRVDHLKPNCVSSELYKYILKEQSTGVFNGKVIVHQDAQKIQAYQQNNNLIISESATMNAKPELEIFADDVKCSHGTTTGQFDEKAIFYLQSRGVSKDAAKDLLIEAVADEVILKIGNEAIIEFVKGI